jgi:hypothetical protein
MDILSTFQTFTLKVPLILNENEPIPATVVDNESFTDQYVAFKISTQGPLEVTDNAESPKKTLFIYVEKLKCGSFHLQTPAKYQYPPGKQGDCLAQASIIVTKVKKLDGRETSMDSLTVSLYIKRKFVNSFVSSWKSTNAWLKRSVVPLFALVIIPVTTYIYGLDFGKIVPEIAFIITLLLVPIPVFYSWLIRDRVISKWIHANSVYSQIADKVK